MTPLHTLVLHHFGYTPYLPLSADIFNTPADPHYPALQSPVTWEDGEYPTRNGQLFNNIVHLSDETVTLAYGLLKMGFYPTTNGQAHAAARIVARHTPPLYNRERQPLTILVTGRQMRKGLPHPDPKPLKRPKNVPDAPDYTVPLSYLPPLQDRLETGLPEQLGARLVKRFNLLVPAENLTTMPPLNSVHHNLADPIGASQLQCELEQEDMYDLLNTLDQATHLFNGRPAPAPQVSLTPYHLMPRVKRYYNPETQQLQEDPWWPRKGAQSSSEPPAPEKG